MKMDSKIQQWKSNLEQTEASLKDLKSIDLSKMKALEKELLAISDYLLSNYQSLEIKDLKALQVDFRNYTDDIFQKSYFLEEQEAGQEVMRAIMKF